MAADGQVVPAQVLRQVLFLMGHADPQAAQLEIQEFGEGVLPVPVIVAAHSLHGGGVLQQGQDARPGDVPGVEDAAAAPECFQHLRAQEVMGVGYDPDGHAHGRFYSAGARYSERM